MMKLLILSGGSELNNNLEKTLVESKMTEQFPLTFIIMLNWNQADLTIACLESLAEISYPNVRIVLVDNGSKDDSVFRIKKQFPQVYIIQNEENLGFSEANNQGIEYALAQGAEYVLLLNNDTVVAPDFLNYLIWSAESDPGIGVVTPKIYYFDSPDRIWCAGAHIDWKTGETYRLKAEQVDLDQSGQLNQTVNFVSACAMCVKREVLETVGFLDPRFFIYYDETDWCVRITCAGFQCVYVPQSKIWHKISAAMGVSSPKTTYYMTRNQILFITKNMHGFNRLHLLTKVLVRHARTVLAYTIKTEKRGLLRNRNSILLGIKDGLLGRFGKAEILILFIDLVWQKNLWITNLKLV